MKKILAIVLAALMALSMVGCGNTSKTEEDVKSEGVMTHAEYMAAENDTEVVIEAYVQSIAFNETYGNASLFLQDHTGGYYVYRMNMTADEAAKIKEGTKLKVTGFKSEWSSEIEIVDATFEIEDGEYIAEPIDVTKFYNNEEELAKYMNMKVIVKDVEIAGSLLDDGTEAAFMYNWDNSGEAGQNCDVYFNILVDGIYNGLVVESDEVAEGTATYTTATELEVGQKVDVVCFLYWYYVSQSHVSSITVK